MNNPFWEYSLAAYERTGVAPLCLALQDEHAVDVNLLLYGAWLGSLHRQLSPGHLRAIDYEVSHWRENVVKPLRQLRRRLAEARSGYADVKALELTAERQQQDVMYRFSAANRCESAQDTLPDNLHLVVGLFDDQVRRWNQAVIDLSELLLDAPVVVDPAGVAPREGR